MQIACAGADTSITSSENVHFFQNIEGYNTTHLEWGTIRARPVTLSFWVKTNKEGIYSVGLENNNAENLFKNHSYGLSQIGTQESVNNISISEIDVPPLTAA